MPLTSTVSRQHYIDDIKKAWEVTPVCCLLGPRQCGKTTLSRIVAEQYDGDVAYFDLEDDRDLARLQDPFLALESVNGLIVMDEIQHMPDIFRALRVLTDQKKPRRFLILGSASSQLLKQSSETLAGRITYIEMTPFQVGDISDTKALLVRGGFPLSYLASSDEASMAWRQSYIKTFLERDIPSLGFRLSPHSLRLFWSMLAHYHGQIINASEIGTSLGITHKTVQSYIDILEATFMVRRLQPWTANMKKRLVKMPRVYMRDTGLLHSLLGIASYEALLGHPKLGASWESLAMEYIIQSYGLDDASCFFWRTHNGAELDLVLLVDGNLKGFEFKYTSAPKLSKSLHSALADLPLAEVTIITPGEDEMYRVHPQVAVCGLKQWKL